MEALEILVIILSVFLGIFLILGIILMVKVIQVMRTLQQVADRIDRMSANIGSSLLKSIRNNVDASAIFAAMISGARKVYKKREQRKDDKEGDE